MTPDEKAALHDYLRDFQPALMDLIPALERLKHDTKDEIAGLMSAALAVVEADRVTRLQEALFLISLMQDVAQLS
jgi:hypothetical protein